MRAFRQEDAEIARFAALNEGYLEKNMRLARLYGADAARILGVRRTGNGGRRLVRRSARRRGTISVGSFVAFGMYLGMLTWPLIALGWVINLFQRGAASMTRLLDILDARSALDEPAHARALPPPAAGRTIEFRDVGFHYPDGTGARAALGAARHQLHRAGRRDDRRRRRDGERQERADGSRPATIRSAGRRDPARRRADS